MKNSNVGEKCSGAAPFAMQFERAAVRALAVILAFLVVPCPGAQPQQKAAALPLPPEIRGVVVEPGTDQAVADAEISLYVQQPGPVIINGGWKKENTKKVSTDIGGGFALPLDKPGPYRVEARKPGYMPPDLANTSDYAEVTLTAEKPKAEVKLFLARSGQLTGTVVDEETRKPIGNLHLRAVHKRSSKSFTGDGTPARTNTGGQFVVAGLSPGEYAVEIGPQTEPGKRVLTKFTEKDAKAEEWDYERTYWPGGRGQEATLPVTVGSGATVNIGQLPVRKVPYYRVHVRIPVSNCGTGETVHVSESTRLLEVSSLRPLARVPCGKDVLVTGFSPGSYRLIFGIDGRNTGNRGTASVPFVITDENIEIIAPLTPGVALSGTLIADQGARPPDFAKVKISLRPVDGVGSFDDAMPAVPGPDGKFRFADVRSLDHRVFISGLGPTSYVKEIRYNGIPMRGDLVPIDKGAMLHELTIVADDKPGRIAGVVTSRGQAVNRPIVIARKWPPAEEQYPFGWAQAKGDDTGRFQVTGLAPGEYRIIALRSVGYETSSTQLEQALTVGKKIEVGPNSFLNVALEPSELR